MKLMFALKGKEQITNDTGKNRQARIPDEKNIETCYKCPYEDCIGKRCPFVK